MLRRDIPSLIADAGQSAIDSFAEYFSTSVPNPHTRSAYLNAIASFSSWCRAADINLSQVTSDHIAEYLERLTNRGSYSTAKVHLSALKGVFRRLAEQGGVKCSPASLVRLLGTKRTVSRKSALQGEHVRKLLSGIGTATVAELRDRALLGFMFYTFARPSAAVAVNLSDYRSVGPGKCIWLRENGRPRRLVPVHPNLVKLLDAYVEALRSSEDHAKPLFRSFRGRGRKLTKNRLTRTDILRIVKRRAARAEVAAPITCRSLRATGIKMYLVNNGSPKVVQAIAGHASVLAATTYDNHSRPSLSSKDLERIAI